ncbi:TonB-dependent receptor [Sphingomonas sp. DBB INV C78]|uniref:TonB-dependent receptor n=1 Tax=Sphingomonas sp. DBB INV C78 TaxID=3349434 RepID=UPI0036D35CF6
MRHRNLLIALMNSVAFGGMAAPALAQDAKADGAGMLDDIVVTAQRREERLIDVPIAISAINEQRLENAGVTTVANIGTVVANIQINETVGNSWSPLISIRGLSPAGDTSLGRDQPVGIYIDGVPVSKSTGAAFDTVDLQRVEVLRGPQGTLYGKNTIGGAVNLVTRKPTGEFGGQAVVGIGNYDQYTEKMSVDLPALEGGFGALKMKFAVSGRQSEGFYDNTGPSRPHFGEQDQFAARADLVWEATDNFSIGYSYDITDNDGTGVMLALSAPGLISPTSAVPALRALYPLIANSIYTDRPDEIGTDATGRSNFGVNGHAITAEYDAGTTALGDVTFKSITAWRNLKTRSNSDFDGTVYDLLRFTLDNNYHQFTQELQAIGTGKDVRYTIGAFYMNDSYSVYNPRWSLRFGNDNRYDLSDRGADNDSIAGYGQITWSPSSLDNKLDLTAGLRWTKETKRVRNLFFSYNNYATNPANPLSGVFQRDANGNPITVSGGPALGALPDSGGPGPYDLSPLENKKSWSRFTPEASISYAIRQDFNIYGRFATGFKSGGFNDTAATNDAFNTAFDPEKLTSFEIGSKGIFANGRLSLNLALYHSIYKDFQAGVFVPTLITTNIINAGKATFTGVEVEGQARLFDNLLINFGYGYTDAKYKEFILPSGEDVTDTYVVPLVPKHNYQIGGQWRIPIGDLDLTPSLNYSWRSSQQSTIAPDPLTKRIAYGVLDGRITLGGIDLGRGTQAEFALWGRNLADKEYWTAAINLGLFTVRQWGDPRSFGAEARIKF